MNKVQIGVVNVDSGQLIICDPCYIEREYETEEFKDVRSYKHIESGEILTWKVDFPNFAVLMPKYGKSMNELINTGEWEKLPMPEPEQNFSYYAVCHATLSDEERPPYHQLNHRMGHPGVAVAFSTKIGDGQYPVIATYNSRNELVSVEVRFD